MTYIGIVGFDYKQAILELNHHGLHYEKIAKSIGYKDKTAIYQIVKGKIPSHVRGEALWALYVEIFGRKPPHNEAQQKGRPISTAPSV